MAESTTKPYSPANPAHVRSRKRAVERERLAVVEAYRWVMSDPRGRLAFRDIIVDGGYYDSPFRADPQRTSYECGRQDGARSLIRFVEDNFPREFLLMENERLAAKIDAKITDEAARTEGSQNRTDEEI